jgi:hypothetical protein
MTPNAIYSKSGKGVQEAAGKTSVLSRGDRAVLSAFDGRLTVKEVAERVGKTFDASFEKTIRQLERDGFVREVSAGAAAAKPGAARPAAPAKPRAPGPPAEDELDFTSIASRPGPSSKQGAVPAAAPDLAAKARAEAERKAKEEQALSYKTRQEAEAKAAAAAKLQAEAEEKAKRQRERAKSQVAPDKPTVALEISFGADLPLPGKSEGAVDPKTQAAAFARAREEAEEKAAKERERIKAEAEAKLLAETEAKLRSEADIKEKEAAEAKRKADTGAEARRKAADAEALVKAAREEALRAAFEAERAAAREEAERARKEAESLRLRLDEERKAREEADRARKEAEERARVEERRRKEDEERRTREDQERRVREERAREEAALREQAEAERRSKEDFERALREVERTQREANEKGKGQDKEKAPAPVLPAGDPFADSLMADLNSFDQRDNEELKAKQEFVRKEKDEAQRRADARADAERKAKEDAERNRREEEERQRKDEADRQAREQRERETREEREREAREAAERERTALIARIEEAAAATKADEDIPVSDSDLDMDDVKRDQAAVSKKARERERNAAKEREREAKEREAEARERARERKRDAKRAAAAPPPVAGTAYAPIRRSRNWGRRIAVTLFILLAAGIAAIHFVPLETQEYEQAASQAIGQPVKIGSIYLSLYNGVLVRMEGVSIGRAKIATARAYPQIGSLFDDKKAFSRIELDNVTMPQRDLGAVLGASVQGGRFSVARVSARKLKLEGVLLFPELEGDMVLARDGSVSSLVLRGPGSLTAKLTPKGPNVEFDVTANSFTLPIAPDFTLTAFAMKGVATGQGMRIDSWGGGTFDGAVSGAATIRWGSNWNIDGVMTVRGMSAALFAPTLLYEGKVEGTGRFSVSGPDPTKVAERGRLEGNFAVPKGVLGAIDLSRAIRTGGREAAGNTPFTGLSAQGLFDKGAIAIRNVAFSAGAMNAGASADITPDGALSGRIVADIRTSSQTLRATVNLGGTLKEPQVKN